MKLPYCNSKILKSTSHIRSVILQYFTKKLEETGQSASVNIFLTASQVLTT